MLTLLAPHTHTRFSGLGNFECASTFTKLQGALTGKKIVDIDCKCDTVLAVSGN